MMRLPRRAALLVAFSLLASAATAYAECAWIVWNQVLSTNPSAPVEGIWQPTVSFKAHAPCQTAAEQMSANNSGIRRSPGGHEYSYNYVCLPDTVDPRGPKGK